MMDRDSFRNLLLFLGPPVSAVAGLFCSCQILFSWSPFQSGVPAIAQVTVLLLELTNLPVQCFHVANSLHCATSSTVCVWQSFYFLWLLCYCKCVCVCVCVCVWCTALHSICNIYKFLHWQLIHMNPLPTNP